MFTTILYPLLNSSSDNTTAATNDHNWTDCMMSSCDVDEEDDNMESIERIFTIVVPVIFTIIVLVGFFGNALVVIVVVSISQMRSTTNLLIINLAVADLLFIVCCVPFTATDYALPYWYFGETWCQIVQFLIIVCAYASIYTLVLMSLDRFLAVVFAIEAMRIRTVRNTIIAICIMWVVILTVSIPALLYHGLDKYEHQNETYYACTFLSEKYSYPWFQISFFLLSYVIPVTLICGLYLVMLNKLWRGVVPGRGSGDDNKRKKRATRLVVVVVLIFIVCWCPIQVVLVIKSLDYYELTPLSVVVQIISQIFAYTNSCINPILYAFLSENFRGAFRKVISCGSESKACRSNSKKNELKTLNKSSRYINNDTEITNALV